MRKLLFFLTIVLIFSGCIEENNATQSNESGNLLSTTPSSEEGNVPEIEVTSFSSIYMHDNLANVENYDYIFSWDNVPGSEDSKLRYYLGNDLGIDWVSTAKIIKTDDNNTIRVFTSTNSIELKLSDDKNTVLITPNQIQLKVKIKNNNLQIYQVETDYSKKRPGYNITESYYAVYELSIKNNCPNDIDFKLNELYLRDGDHVSNTSIEPEDLFSSCLNVPPDFKNETEVEDTTLSPGKTINGSVVFQVNSLYNKSFLLMYNKTPVPSASFEESIEALKIAEGYDYSVILGIPPYNSGSPDDNSFKPDLEEYPYIWANWVNRNIFEFFDKADHEEMENLSLEYIPRTKVVYVLKVIPERNITLTSEKPKLSQNNFIVVDNTGKELINASNSDKIAILKNQTYEPFSGENGATLQVNFSNVTIVKIHLTSFYEWGHITSVNQDVIMDKELNIIAARNCARNFIS
ncbi:hypothetical protein FXW07_00105 [Methanosarcina sp. DH1]|uniref:hypothetical protein n=1 Tax=Methanosarcina sp. DH1 TaxID=2605695 RepID=UPI001E534C03|nr:hypothetical protein [Methanosarcina sp. DH1]MCC4765088.1 hypothetical protein [Methanosarcina sp. DH1]